MLLSHTNTVFKRQILELGVETRIESAAVYCMYHKMLLFGSVSSSHSGLVCVCVWYEYQDKQRLLPSTARTQYAEKKDTPQEFNRQFSCSLHTEMR